MSASSGKLKASELPEVFILSKELLFDPWRQTFAEACRALGIRKILKTTPATKDLTTKFTTSFRAAEQMVYDLQRMVIPPPTRIKEQLPDFSQLKPDEQGAAVMDYHTKAEKADAVFEKEWVNYLREKQAYEARLRGAQDELLRMKNAGPSLDDEVVEIRAKTKKMGTKSYEYTPTFDRTQTLDAEEAKLFGVDHEWINAETGDYESVEETAARMRLWKWMDKSLVGGPCKHLISACKIPGDIRSVYYEVKEKCTRVTVLTFGLAYSEYFRKDKYLKETDPQIIYTSLKQEASTLEEMGRTLGIPPSVHPQIIKSQLMVALMLSDPEKINQRAMMDMIAGNMEFTSEELLEHLRKQHLLARELKGVNVGKGLKPSKVEANEMVSKAGKAVGVCYDYQTETGCSRKDCRFRHEKYPASAKNRPKDRERSGVGRCMRCSKEGHRGSECPDRKKLLCNHCGKKGHCVETCLTNPDNETPSPPRYPPETMKGGGKGVTRGRGGRGGRGGREKTSMAHAVKTTHEESDSMDESSSQSDGSEWEYRGTMVLQSKQKAHSNTLPKVKKDEVRLLIDSGCDTLAMMHRRDGFDWRPGKMKVNEATEGRSTLVGCKGQVELEFPMGGKLAVSEAIYSKDFRHNLCGTSTLGKAGFSTLMHEGKVFLIDAKSMGELPKAWKVRACEGVDRDTGLPFIVMKRQKPKRVDAALKKEAKQKKEDATQVKQRNASWRSHREDSTPINLAKSYPERKVSRGDSAMGGGGRIPGPRAETTPRRRIERIQEGARTAKEVPNTGDENRKSALETH